MCSYIEQTDLINFYSRKFSTFKYGYTLAINFKKIGLKEGDKFEAIAYIEQEQNSQMLFFTDILTSIVGEIKEEIHFFIYFIFILNNKFNICHKILYLMIVIMD